MDFIDSPFTSRLKMYTVNFVDNVDVLDFSFICLIRKIISLLNKFRTLFDSQIHKQDYFFFKMEQFAGNLEQPLRTHPIQRLQLQP